MPKQNYGKTNKEYVESMQNTTKKMKNPYQYTLNGYHCMSQYVKQQKTTNYDKATVTSRGSYLMYADEHTELFINKTGKARTIYTKI